MPKFLNPNEMHELLTGVSPEISNAVNNRVRECLDLLGDKFDKAYPMPTITYDLKGRTAGQAVYPNTIRLNPEALVNNLDDMIQNTVGHEVAHIVQYAEYPHSKSHGWEWIRLMLMLNLVPNRTHTYKVTPSRVVPRPYTMYCYCGEHHLTRTTYNRILFEGRKYRCKRCLANLQDEPYEGGE